MKRLGRLRGGKPERDKSISCLPPPAKINPATGSFTAIFQHRVFCRLFLGLSGSGVRVGECGGGDRDGSLYESDEDPFVVAALAEAARAKV
jgi:hypothetical protein